MKSSAFNLAFKVHRNELPFAEGILKSVEEGVQEDFIEALNSLAGEQRYDINQLESLVNDAQQSTVQEFAPSIDPHMVKEELISLKKQKQELQESIRTYESQKASLVPTVVPGINSFLISLVGIVISFVFMLMELMPVFLIGIVCSIGAAAGLLIMDMDKLKKQKEKIRNKKDRIDKNIIDLKKSIKDLDSSIQEKEDLIRTALQQRKDNQQPQEPSSHISSDPTEL